MPIGLMVELLSAYQRYVDYMNDNGFDDVVASVKDVGYSLLVTMRGHMGETYEMVIYFSEKTGELCIENAVTHESVFDVLDFEEYEVTEELLHYFKYGKSESMPVRETIKESDRWAVFRFFSSGVKNTMKYRKKSFLRALAEEVYMMFRVMGIRLYIQYAHGTAVFDESE